MPYTSGLQLIKASKLSLLPENPYKVGDMFPPQDYDVAFAYNARKHVSIHSFFLIQTLLLLNFIEPLVSEFILDCVF